MVGGFTDPQGGRVGLGALLVGYFEGDDFVFAGKVGTGFDTKLLLDLRARLDAIELPKTPFTQGDRPAAPARALGEAGDRRAGRVHSSGPGTASCATRGCSASAPTRRRATSCGRRPIVTRGRPAITHPEKVLFPDDGITKGELAAYYEAIAPLMLPHLTRTPDHHGAVPGGHRRGRLPPEERDAAASRLARTRRGAEEGRHGELPARERRAVAALDDQPEHDHAARLDLARAGSLSPRHLRLRSRSVRSTTRTCCARPRSACAICWRSSG